VSASILLVFIRLYKTFLAPFFGGACKYHPSCSNYAYEAIARHGAGRGVVLALKRLGRCRPFTQGGYDPVPEIFQTRTERPDIAAQGPVR
jgi:putative membrane protein insertion efficiency factor